MDERGSLIDEIGHLEIQLLASALPQETSSLLDYDLTLQQIRVFAHVFAARQIPITRLADMLDIRPNVATGIVQRLVERGLIERREEPSDRRVRILSVTDQGQALLDELGRIILGKERGLLERLSDQQLIQLRDLMTAMAAPQQGEEAK